MKAPRGPFRLVDGVVVAAIGLLSLKALGLFAATGEAERPEPAFGRILAHARSNYVPGDPVTTGSIAEKDARPAVENKPAAPAAAPPPLIPPSASEKALFERLTERREELQQRQREMEAREKLIQEQERKLDERLGQGRTGAEEARKAAPAKAEAEGAALKTLVVMYETMKPKEAARVFDRLQMDVLVPVVTQMNARKMAEVLAAMTPETAEKLTVALARRARSGREEGMPAANAGLPAGELQAVEPPAGRRPD